MSVRATSATWLLLCTLPLTSLAAGCPTEHDGRKLLGEMRLVTTARSDLLVRVEQRDLDIQVVVHRAGQHVAYAGPAGRTGREWIYLATAAPAQHQVCIYPAFRHAGAGTYEISSVELPSAGRSRHADIRAMSEAGRLWATRTSAGRAAAIQKYDEAARTSPDPWQLADEARLDAAWARVERYDYVPALASFRQLAAESGVSGHVRYRAQWGIGNVLNRRGDFAGSRVALQQALRIAKQESAGAARTDRDRADIMSLLGEVLLSEGAIEAGEKILRNAQALAGGDHQLLGVIHDNLEYVSIQRADRGDIAQRPTHLATGLREELRARNYAMLAGDRLQWSVIENNIGGLFERIGDVRRARAQYEGALALIDPREDPLRRKMLYRTLGNTYRTLGDYPKSARFLADALELAERSEPGDAILLLCQLGTTRRLMGQLTQAITAHQRCRQRAAAALDARVEVQALHELTIDLKMVGKDQDAWLAIRAAQQRLPKVSDVDTRCNVLTQYALLLQARGDQQAQRVAEAAVAAAAGARYPASRVDALAAAMTVSLAQGQRAQGKRYGYQAIQAIETIHASLDAERLGPAWSARTQHVFLDMIGLVVADPDVPPAARLSAALQLLERSRAISLRQQLSAAEIPQDTLAQVPLLRALSELADASAAEGKSSGAGLPLAYYHEHSLLTLYRLSGAKDVPVPRVQTTDELQRALGPRRAALLYFLTAQRAYLFVLTATTLDLADLGPRSQVSALAARVRQAAGVGPNALTAPLRALAQLVLPASKLPTVDDLLVTLDGELNAIPFGALDIGLDAARYVPVLQRFNVRVVPSLSAFFMARRNRRLTPSVDLAVFANPRFQLPQTAPANAPSWTQRLQSLPSSDREARNLRALFPATRVQVYSGPDATRDNLRSAAARNARVLHIASHGYFLASSPENVGFALAPSARGGSVESGFVTLTELFTYRSGNQLVVISGCDTALGPTQGGEGMMSVSRAFLAQGASHVISTLWEVSDRVSADFMTKFYERLRTLGSISKALRATQLEFIADRDMADPFFWAPYLLTTVSPDDSIALSGPRTLTAETQR